MHVASIKDIQILTNNEIRIKGKDSIPPSFIYARMLGSQWLLLYGTNDAYYCLAMPSY